MCGSGRKSPRLRSLLSNSFRLRFSLSLSLTFARLKLCVTETPDKSLAPGMSLSQSRRRSGIRGRTGQQHAVWDFRHNESHRALSPPQFTHLAGSKTKRRRHLIQGSLSIGKPTNRGGKEWLDEWVFFSHTIVQPTNVDASTDSQTTQQFLWNQMALVAQNRDRARPDAAPQFTLAHYLINTQNSQLIRTPDFVEYTLFAHTCIYTPYSNTNTPAKPPLF